MSDNVAAQGDYPHDDPCDRWEMVTYAAPSGFRVVMEKSDHGMFVSIFGAGPRLSLNFLS